MELEAQRSLAARKNSKLKNLDNILERFSLNHIFLLGILVYVVAYIIIFLVTNFMIFSTKIFDPYNMFFLFYDFRRYYYAEGLKIVNGQIPFVNYVPLYPIIAEYYLALFTIFGQNPHIARIFQMILIIGTLWIGMDLVKLIDLKNAKTHYFLLIISLPFFIFTLYQINYDILVVFSLSKTKYYHICRARAMVKK